MFSVAVTEILSPNFRHRFFVPYSVTRTGISFFRVFDTDSELVQSRDTFAREINVFRFIGLSKIERIGSILLYILQHYFTFLPLFYRT